jgi:hypothetical protein
MLSVSSSLSVCIGKTFLNWCFLFGEHLHLTFCRFAKLRLYLQNLCRTPENWIKRSEGSESISPAILQTCCYRQMCFFHIIFILLWFSSVGNKSSFSFSILFLKPEKKFVRSIILVGKNLWKLSFNWAVKLSVSVGLEFIFKSFEILFHLFGLVGSILVSFGFSVHFLKRFSSVQICPFALEKLSLTDAFRSGNICL